MATLIIAEKPSVARDFVAVLDGVRKRSDYYEGTYDGERTYVTWCRGHLLELKEPGDLNPKWKKWELETLPVVPERFEYTPMKDTSGLLRTLTALLKKSDRVVVATDADQEGEVIGRLALQYCGLDPSRHAVYRFWTSDTLEPHVIRKELRRLKRLSEFDSLYEAGIARQHADYVIGMSLSRAISVAAGKGVWSAGRVQTAVLALLAEREEKIRDFRPQPFWSLLDTGYNAYLIRSEALSGIPALVGETEAPENRGEETVVSTVPFRFARSEDARRVAEAVAGKPREVITAERNTRKEIPPRLFNLTDVQREANKYFGFSSQKTLSLMQRLYERKLISYPRSEGRHMGEDNLSMVRKLYQEFSGKPFPEKYARSKRLFDSKAVAKAGHHAVIPKKRAKLDGDEAKVYELILKRFLAAFDEPHVYEEARGILETDGYRFAMLARATRAPGWRAVYDYGWKPYSDMLPEFGEGDLLPAGDVDVKKGETKPPPRFTDAGILTLMTNVHRLVDDPARKEALKKAEGIGTPATRASIIETLKKRDYAGTKGKTFYVTEKGLRLYEMLKRLGLSVGDLVFVALWEQELEKIRRGEKTYSEFLDLTVRIARNEIEKIVQKKEEFEKMAESVEKNGNGGVTINCPKCNKEMRVNRGGAFCGDTDRDTGEVENGCGFKVWRKQFGKALTDSQLKTLVTKGEVHVKGLVSKRTGKKYEATVVLKDDGNTELRFDN